MPLTTVIGDPHLDSKACLREAFLQTVRKVASFSDLILFNGDFIDTYGVRGKQAFDWFVDWSDDQGFKEQCVYISGGMGHEGNVLFDRPDVSVLPYALLETLEGRVVVFHGHNVPLIKRSGESWRQALVRLKRWLVREGSPFLPKIYPTDKIIVSHTHYPVYDMDNGVFATGPWKLRAGQTPAMVQAQDPRTRSLGVFIIIDDERREDPIHLYRWYDRLPYDQ